MDERTMRARLRSLHAKETRIGLSTEELDELDELRQLQEQRTEQRIVARNRMRGGAVQCDARYPHVDSLSDELATLSCAPADEEEEERISQAIWHCAAQFRKCDDPRMNPSRAVELQEASLSDLRMVSGPRSRVI